jgi:hypothetical protein
MKKNSRVFGNVKMRHMRRHMTRQAVILSYRLPRLKRELQGIQWSEE